MLKGSKKKEQDGGQKVRRDQHDPRREGNIRRHNGGYMHYSSVHDRDKAKEAEQDDGSRRQIGKYCTYHKMNGHRTKD